MKRGYVVAIDGPVASGKGTIAHELAKTIKAVNFNTGGIWRAYTYKLLDMGVEPSSTVVSKLQGVQVSMDIRKDGTFDVLLDGEIVTDKLNDPVISRAVSKFGVYPEFAKFIIDESRRVALEYVEAGTPIVIEGRQIGTVVFPYAEVKIFLTADLTVRAQRRYKQYKNRGIDKPLEEVLKETQERDTQDLTRAYGALPSDPEAKGYILVDNSTMDEAKTMNKILDILHENRLWKKN